MQYTSYIITAISIIATVANAFQKRWCFIVWLFTNLFWIIYDLWIGAYGQALLYVANFVICVIGLRNWKKKTECPCDKCVERKRADSYRKLLEDIARVAGTKFEDGYCDKKETPSREEIRTEVVREQASKRQQMMRDVKAKINRDFKGD